MNPGRFVSVWFLCVGTLLLLSFLFGVASGELQVGLSAATFGALTPGIATLFIGVHRISNPTEETWPEEYGVWTYVASLFLVGMAGWLVYILVW
ncbi:hypothetical protein [Natronorubrum thiooxidans]|uniref:Uncharacterized protein n=1 Tax=Natronorubrum thiooxidans TaxID=308853 RepID=A0A1N7FT44_9EURY|nr:hypothetical protein [Natronorubrum thiooxidans]SIS03444.1 hypothetical protein SAMN05421752_10854 [Natronorubrum thiooxidans]